MTILDTAKVTSKGQITIPNRIRRLLHLAKGSSVAFGIEKHGIVLLPCKITAESPFTNEEWKKIQKLCLEKGKTYNDAVLAKKHIEAL